MVLESVPAVISGVLSSLAAYGYVGAFVISLIGSATVLFPVPYFIVIFGLAATLNPVVLITVTAIGSSIGELVGFYVGALGNRVIKRGHKKPDKHNRWVDVMKTWFKRNGFLTLVIIAASPLPTDIGGLIAGGLKYDVRKFFLAMLIGKAVKFAFIIYAGFYSLHAVEQYFGI